jgi:hypothetical protein
MAVLIKLWLSGIIGVLTIKIKIAFENLSVGSGKSTPRVIFIYHALAKESCSKFL